MTLTPAKDMPWPQTAKEAAANGARWLDWHSPRWYNGDEADRFWEGHIDLDLLDLASGSSCVLAQLSGVQSYDDGLGMSRRLQVPDFPEDIFYAGDEHWQPWYDNFSAVKFGFEAGDGHGGDYGYDELTNAWRDEIVQRRQRDDKERQAEKRKAAGPWR